MRGSRAKAIRREVYGDQSTRISNRHYDVKNLGIKIIKWLTSDDKERKFYMHRTIVRTVGLRRRYQQAKRDHKRGLR